MTTSAVPGPDEDPQSHPATSEPDDPPYAANPGAADPSEPQPVLEPDDPTDAPD